MKSISYIFSFVALLLLNVACSSSSSEDKATALEGLRAQQAELSTKIKQLESEIAAENPEQASANLRLKQVMVKQLALKKFDHYVQTQGTVTAENNISVSAKSMGVITNVLVTEGQSVEKGQVLAQIDNSVYVKGIEEVKTQLELATTVFERQKNLWDQKIGSEIQYLQAKSGKESLENRLASLYEQNDMTRIKAPVSGTIDAISVKVGENIAPGMPAFRVVNTSDMRVKATLSEAYASLIKKGNKVLVKVPGVEKEIETKVSFAGRTINPMSLSFDVEVAVPSSANLNPNQTAVMKVIFKTVESAVVVPINLVQNINGEKVIFIAEAKDGKIFTARKKVIIVDGVFDNQAQVVSGLSGNEQIITVGFQGLNDGQLIKL